MDGFTTTQGHGEMSGPGLLPGPVSGFTSLMQPQTVLTSETLDTTQGKEDRTLQRWSCPRLGATLGRAGLTPVPTEALRGEGPRLHLRSTIELTLFLSMGELVLWRETGEQVTPLLYAMWWHG